MDSGEGHFNMLEKEQAKELSPNPRIFHINEEIQIRESLFKVVKITPKKLTLRILPSK